jgi:hypothetical protein
MCGGSDEASNQLPHPPGIESGRPHSKPDYQSKAYQIVADPAAIAATVIGV